MEKTYKVTHKTYFNERLKAVSFHGRQVHPLYIKVTFDRKAIYFKSYYFDLLSKPQYAVPHITGNKYPSINEVMAKEEALINFIINENKDHFSLALFKKRYDYLSRDLLDLMDEAFKDYLYVFFHDEGLHVLAFMTEQYGKSIQGIQIINGLKPALKRALLSKLIENAVFYAPPYIPLQAFVVEKKKDSLIIFSVYEWEKLEIKKAFWEFTAKFYPRYEREGIEKEIKKIL